VNFPLEGYFIFKEPKMPEKRYYWLKLNQNYFDNEAIKILENMENGKDYVIFLLKMQLRSIKFEGRLRVTDMLPYDAKMLSDVTNTNIDIVKVAISTFKKMGLIDIWDDGTIYLECVQEMIGSESAVAERVRRHREKQKLIEQNTDGTPTVPLQCNKNETQIKSKIKSKSKKEESKSSDLPFLFALLQYLYLDKTKSKPIFNGGVGKMFQKYVAAYGLNKVTICLVIWAWEEIGDWCGYSPLKFQCDWDKCNLIYSKYQWPNLIAEFPSYKASPDDIAEAFAKRVVADMDNQDLDNELDGYEEEDISEEIY
jgi:predicted phage replisome organizer